MHVRLKREDCKHTKHDFVFSKWEILIGPNDWEDHASGKDGIERYRIHNLPNSSACPGLYELGVASIPTNEGKRLRKLDSENIIVVYLGQADNIRTRLQEYGRSGSHLDHVNLTTRRKYYESSAEGGPGLFKEIFSKGCSIMFRWSPMKTKMKAEKTEMELLYIFDYAWNRRGNGVCRHADILEKLNHNSQNPVLSPLSKLLQWKQEAFNKREGINIDADGALFQEEILPRGLKGYLLPQVFKFSSSRLQFLPGDHSSTSDQIICGVATGLGSICVNQPVPGRKRCAEHKGKKITGIGSSARGVTVVSNQKGTSSSDILIVDGTKAHDLGKERRVTQLFLNETRLPFHQYQPQLPREKFSHDNGDYVVCGVVNGVGCMCKRRPVFGRKRCEEHKGMRLSAHNMRSSLEKNICEAINDNGRACNMLPVPGRKRFEEHKGMRMAR